MCPPPPHRWLWRHSTGSHNLSGHTPQPHAAPSCSWGWSACSWKGRRCPHTGSCPGQGLSVCPAALVSHTNHTPSSSCSSTPGGLLFAAGTWFEDKLQIFPLHMLGKAWLVAICQLCRSDNYSLHSNWWRSASWPPGYTSCSKGHQLLGL